MDRVSVQASSSGEAAGYAPTWTGHWLGSLPGGGSRLCSTIRRSHRLCSIAGQDCRVGSATGQDHRVGSRAVQAHCSGSLVLQCQRLYLIVYLPGLLGWLPAQAGLQDSPVAAQILWPGGDGGYTQHWTVMNVLPCPCGATEQAPYSVWFVGWGPK